MCEREMFTKVMSDFHELKTNIYTWWLTIGGENNGIELPWCEMSINNRCTVSIVIYDFCGHNKIVIDCGDVYCTDDITVEIGGWSMNVRGINEIVFTMIEYYNSNRRS